MGYNNKRPQQALRAMGWYKRLAQTLPCQTVGDRVVDTAQRRKRDRERKCSCPASWTK